jgi:hypothetical protein
VLSDADTKNLLKLNADAKDLKNYRENGTLYLKKCAEVLERTKLFLGSMILENLTDEQGSILKSIKKAIGKEENFAKSSFEIRNLDAWKEFLND